MPTYEYVCGKCGHEFELFQSMTAEPLSVCPKEHCGRKTWGRGKVTRKIGGGAGLLFKGSGFYITDYRSENYKVAAKKETESKGGASGGEKSAGGTPAKSDSKPTPATTATPSQKKD